MGSLPLLWEQVGFWGYPMPPWTAPDPLRPLVPLPSLKAPFAHTAAPGLLQGSESLYQLQTRDPTISTTPEKWRKKKDAETEGYRLCQRHDAPVLDAGSTGDVQHSCQAGTTPRSTN